jgi:hypothetical protein
MRKRFLPVVIALAVSAMFILPGLAFGAGGNGTPNPPPSNPPCDADGHDGLAPPYGGPNLNSGSCDNGTGTATGDATGNACPPDSHNPDGTPPDCGHGTSSTSTTGSSSTSTTGTSSTSTTGSSSTSTTGSTSTSTTGGAANDCTWNITIAGTEILSGTSVDGLIGVHADIVPDPAIHPGAPIGLVHACLGVGSIVSGPSGPPCPTGTVPIEVQTDQASYLLLCVLL